MPTYSTSKGRRVKDLCVCVWYFPLNHTIRICLCSVMLVQHVTFLHALRYKLALMSFRIWCTRRRPAGYEEKLSDGRWRSSERSWSYSRRVCSRLIYSRPPPTHRPLPYSGNDQNAEEEGDGKEDTTKEKDYSWRKVPPSIHVPCARRSIVDNIDLVNIWWHVMCS